MHLQVRQADKLKFLKEIFLRVVEELDYLLEKMKKEINYIDNIFNHKKINEILKKYDKNYDEKDFFDLQQKI